MPDTTVEVNALWRISLSPDKNFLRIVLFFLKERITCEQCALNALFSFESPSKETTRRMQVFPSVSGAVSNPRLEIAQKDNRPLFDILYLVWAFNQ